MNEKLVTLPQHPANFVDGTVAVGNSLGFQVRQMSREEPAVLFGRLTDKSWLEGKRTDESVRVKLEPDGRTVLIHAQIVGNFGVASQEAADALIAQFQSGLMRQFGA